MVAYLATRMAPQQRAVLYSTATARYVSVNQKTVSMKQLMASILNEKSSTHDQLRSALQSSKRLQDILQKVCYYLLPPLLPSLIVSFATADLLRQQIIDISSEALNDLHKCIQCLCAGSWSCSSSHYLDADSSYPVPTKIDCASIVSLHTPQISVMTPVSNAYIAYS